MGICKWRIETEGDGHPTFDRNDGVERGNAERRHFAGIAEKFPVVSKEDDLAHGVESAAKGHILVQITVGQGRDDVAPADVALQIAVGGAKADGRGAAGSQSGASALRFRRRGEAHAGAPKVGAREGDFVVEKVVWVGGGRRGGGGGGGGVEIPRVLRHEDLDLLFGGVGERTTGRDGGHVERSFVDAVEETAAVECAGGVGAECGLDGVAGG